MKRDDVLEIAIRLKREGRAISPVNVCLEAYGRALPEIAETLQRWCNQRVVPADPPTSPVAPEDFGEMIRGAIEQCWELTQKSVRGQLATKMRVLRQRAEEAEQEAGLLYVDLTRTLRVANTT